MRIPVSKAYRAFPELDRFSDAECEAFVRLARAQFKWSERRHQLVSMVALGLAIGLGAYGTDAVVEWAQRARDNVPSVTDDWIAAVGISLPVITACLVVLVRYDRWLRRAILVRLRETKCISCSYSLLGLPVVGGGIVCPECGQRFGLAERGLTAADVLAGAVAQGKS